jgi:tetratricopeptide (TPR) repeat protein
MKKKPPSNESDVSDRQMADLMRELLSALQPALAAAVDDPLHQLPAPPPDFAGRAAELAELTEQIESGVAAGAVLQGPDGVGKTALALKLAAELAPVYADAQFFLDLRGGAGQPPLAPADAMAHVIRACHPERATTALPESAAELSKLYAAALRGRRTLLLLDNAADAAQIEPLLPPAGCVLLATSGQAFTLPGLFGKQLEALPAAESRDLLLRIAPRAGKHADALVELCGGLPLALRLAAGELAAQAKLTPAAYVKRLKEQRRSLEPLAAVLGLNYDLMPPVPRGLWRELTVFPATFDADAAAAVWDMQLGSMWEPRPALVDTALDNLVKRGLLEKLEGAEGKDETQRYRLHDAARTAAAARLNDDERVAAERVAAERRHAQHYLNALETAMLLHQAGSAGIEAGLALCDRERLNIAAGRAWAAAHSSADTEAAKWAADYLYLGIPVLVFRLSADEIAQWLRDAVEAARAVGNRKKESELLGQIGSAYQDLGNNRLAVEHYQKALAAARESGDRAVERRALGGLGDAYQALGEMQKAIDVYRQYLDFTRETGDRRAESYLLNNLGAAYGKLGRTRDALECFQRQLELTREIGDRENEGRVLGNLGVVHIEAGETPAAIEYFNQALVILREIGERSSQAEMLGNLGGAYYLAGELEQAAKAYERASTVKRKLGDRRGAGDALWNQSMALDQLGDRARAVECAEAALQLREESGDPRATEVRRQLARWRGERDRFSGH